jgi:hypothetical protein
MRPRIHSRRLVSFERTIGVVGTAIAMSVLALSHLGPLRLPGSGPADDAPRQCPNSDCDARITPVQGRYYCDECDEDVTSKLATPARSE